MKDGELGRLYEDREVIFREGDMGDVMYVIQTGKVNIEKKIGNEDVVLATLESGEIFGEMALFDRMPRSATAVVSGKTRLLSVDRKKLFSTINRDPTLVLKILETMSLRIRRLTGEVMKLKKNKMKIIRSCMNIEDTCRLVLDEARNLITADNGSIMLFGDDGKSLSIKAAFGIKSEARLQLSLGEGIAGDVIRTGMPELVNNVSMDSRFVDGKTKIKSIICTPLKFGERVLGVINMSNISDRLFSVDDLKLLNSLSIYASIAVQNAISFSQLKKVTEEIMTRAVIYK
jgi:putative methionine-R-sulfoxide reductase with GAF domain